MTEPLFLINPERDDVPLNSDELRTGWTITLPSHIKKHALSAMRMEKGEALLLANGRGLRIRAVVEDSKEGIVTVESFSQDEEPTARLRLIQALAKGGHDEQAIDIATQIGVDEVVPWQAHRSIAKFKRGKTDKRWLDTLTAASEQSRRSRIPLLRECMNDNGIEAECRRACVHGDLMIVLHQDATDTMRSIEQSVDQMLQKSLDDGKSRTISVIVGPEGGISEEEVARFVAAGAKSCILGNTILRASSAGPVALSVLSYLVGRIR